MAPHQQKILHIAGHRTCGFYTRAVNLVKSLTVLFPTRIKVIPHEFPDRSSYRQWLLEGNGDNGGGFRQNFADNRAKVHSSSPFCWFSGTDCDPPTQQDIDSFLGGHDDTIEWCRKFCSPQDSNKEEEKNVADMVDDGHSPDHGYDYDLAVIGGGSGGMAAAKEAASLGAKVVLLDYVKASPYGTVWGLGGTCVNVGCIPKKLMHAGSLLHESMHQDSATFGIETTSPNTKGTTNGEPKFEVPDPTTQTHWNILRDNVQNYIRSLNFKYRVNLRQKEVTYLNKLGRLVDAHTIETTDKKGKSSTITTSRVLLAVGGRPTPLECKGGELAISSDDLFALEKNPGKTLCIGASYISLECAGFLAGLGHDVTVAVRSILLRGFDRECSDKIGSYMEAHGVNFKKEVTPSKLEKVSDGKKTKVTFSDGSTDTYDTVLTAIGRRADTAKLGLENIGIADTINAKNGRIIGKHEQTKCPNVYAVGDVLDGTPELTPVAIQAGIALSRRLFGGSKQAMDYVNVCTTVFTPIEYACVGLSEDDAMEQFGEANIEVYHKEFLPLEWSLSPRRGADNAFTKVIVDKSDGDKVLGIHFVGPNAGEVMQGFGVAMKRGIDFKTLAETVGIHPTSAEEITTLSVTKASGEDAAATGC